MSGRVLARRRSCSIQHSRSRPSLGTDSIRMQITERTINDVTILDLEGRLTIGDGAELLRDTVKSLVSQGKTKVAASISRSVPYVDSGGLGELVPLLWCRAKKANGTVKLIGLASEDHRPARDHQAGRPCSTPSRPSSTPWSASTSNAG